MGRWGVPVRGRRRGRPGPHGLGRGAAFAAVCLTVASVSGSAGSVGAARPERAVAAATGTDGVTVRVVAVPKSPKPGTAVRFSVEGRAPHARGALGYEVSYGDGSAARRATPQFCLSAPHGARGRWTLSHRYRRRGRFTVDVTVRAGCSAGAASVELRLSVR